MRPPPQPPLSAGLHPARRIMSPPPANERISPFACIAAISAVSLILAYAFPTSGLGAIHSGGGIASDFGGASVLPQADWCDAILSDCPLLWSITLCTHAAPSPGHGITLSTTLRYLPYCDETGGGRHISSDSATERNARRILGPHEFFFLLEGIETLWAPQMYLGNCTYRFDAHLVLPAPRHRLFLAQLRTNFTAFDELNEVYPELNVLTLANGTFLHLPNLSLDRKNETPLLSPALLSPSPQLPRCKSGMTAPGRFVLLGNATPALFLAPVEYNKACFQHSFPTASFFVDISSENLVRWEPYSCSLPHITQRDFRERLSGLRLDFLGDSHMRILYNHLLRRFCGVENAASKGFGVSQCQSLGDMTHCPRLSACLINSPFGLEGAESEGHGAERDLLIANFGAWPTGGAFGRWTLQQYAAGVRAFAERMTDPRRAQGSPSFIWIGNIQHPFRDDEFVHNLRAWNTPSRTFMFERFAQAELAMLVAQGRVHYVDVFALSMVSNRWSQDCAHLVGVEPALNGITDLLLSQVNFLSEKKAAEGGGRAVRGGR